MLRAAGRDLFKPSIEAEKKGGSFAISLIPPSLLRLTAN